MILSVTFFAAINNANLGSLVQKLMKDSMNNFDERHRDHGVTKGIIFGALQQGDQRIWI